MGRLTQRQIRDAMVAAHPREAARSLERYSVETIARTDAQPIIMKYEWLQSMGGATLFVGLLSPTREIEGVACFGYGPAYGPSNIRRVIGEPAWCLERGACVHYAPRNAASFLITNACKLVARITGVARFYAYADPGAGEYGAVYQSCNWFYLGQGLNGKEGRAERYYALKPGDDPEDPRNWKTTRILRQQKPPLGFAEAKAQGWQISKRAGKHVYAINIGRDRKIWRRSMVERCGQRPYPAPRPMLKRKAQSPQVTKETCHGDQSNPVGS